MPSRNRSRNGRAGRAIVLLSGGLDSCVAATIARDQGLTITALSFRYGQRHARELASARKVAKALGVDRHVILKIDLGKLGGSALTDRTIRVPTGRSARDMGHDIPVTYVPARNTVFLAFALGAAEVDGADSIYIGANALDFSGYPDCRPEYYRAFQRLANVATKRAVEGHPIRIRAPLLQMSKADIVREGVKRGAPLHLTWSCYQGGRHACGRCDSCILRLEGFRKAGLKDPVPYARS